MVRFWFACLFLFFTFSNLRLWAQDTLYFRNDISVEANGSLLNAPWGGGLNCPQFSKIDLDGDGLKDLFVFDRQDYRAQTYINTGKAGKERYRYAPEWLQFFPTTKMEAWVLLVDYNCDGYEDLFTSVQSNFRVYKNITPNLGKLGFEWVTDGLSTIYNPNTPNQFPVLLYCQGSDIPGIIDIDFDGDIDVLTYDINGIAIEYHENRAMEDFGRCDTLVFQNASQCWGHFQEIYDAPSNSYSAELETYNCAGEFKTNHVGGAILPLNLNGDTLMDVIVTDNGPSYALAVSNGGNRQIANMTDQDAQFPVYDTRLLLDYFPGLFHVDVDEDGVRDLVAAPNQTDVSRDHDCIWYYRNVGPDDFPEFRLQEKNFLQSEMIELGSGARPCLFDYNRDGLLDLMVGNESRFISPTQKSVRLELYLNVGDSVKPAFRLENKNFLDYDANPLTTNVRALAPAAGDIDGDGRPEIAVGQASGKIWLFKDLSPVGSSVPEYSLFNADFLNIPPNLLNSAPYFYDLDADGDLDVVVGNRAGTLWLYKNDGTPTAPQFTPFNPKWGKVSVTDPFSFLGYSHPVVANIDEDPEPELLVGAANGYIYLFDSITVSLTDSFPPKGIIYNYKFGQMVKPALAKLDTSKGFALLVGAKRGGVELFQYIYNNRYTRPDTTDTTENPIDTTSVADLILRRDLCQAFPSPASYSINIKRPAGVSVEIINPTGQIVWRSGSGWERETLVPLHNFPNGIYACVFRQKSQTFCRKFLIQKE